MARKKYFFMLLFFIFAIVASAEISLSSPRVTLVITQPDVKEGTVIADDIMLNVDSALPAETFLVGEIGNVSTKRSLEEIFDDQNIPFDIEESAATATNPESTKTFVFPASGKQHFSLKIPKGSTIDDVEMSIKGLPQGTSYPANPSIDIAADGNVEWKYNGRLIGFSNLSLPAGLQENRESGVVYITNKEEYFCEIVSLANGKDFEVSAKYATAENIQNANLTAVIFSFTGSGTSINAQGGANTCSMPDPTNDLSYSSCIVHFNTFIQGNKLVCVYDKNFGDGNAQQYRLAKDDAPGSGYRCNRLQNGQTTCQRQITDFFIKARTGDYDHYLKEQADFDGGRTEYTLERELENFLEDCELSDEVNCVVPVSIDSKSGGIIYIDNLKIKYRSGGSLFIENNFYDATANKRFFSTINNINLLVANFTNMSLTFPLSVLGLVAPAITTQEKNFTLRAGLEAGPSDQKSIRVFKGAGVLGNATDTNQLIDAYKNIISNLAENQQALFSALGKKQDLEKAVDDLDKLRARWQNVANSNLTQDQKAREKSAILQNVTSLTNNMPRTVVITKSISDIVVPGYEDIRSDISADEESRKKLYNVQESFSVNGKAEYFEIVYFNNATEHGTLITKRISGSAQGSGSFTETVPSSVASASEVSYPSGARVLRQNDPLILEWATTELSGTVSYIIKRDATNSLDQLKTVIVAEVPEQEPEQQPLAVCGDNVCNYVMVDSEKVFLEDKYSCPQDCKPRYSYMVLIIALLLVAAIVVYVYVYKGKYSFSQMFDKGRELNDGKSSLRTIMYSNDEQALRDYISESLSKGFSKQRITDTLVARGWKIEQVNQVFKNLKK